MKVSPLHKIPSPAFAGLFVRKTINREERQEREFLRGLDFLNGAGRYHFVAQAPPLLFPIHYSLPTLYT